MASAGAGTHGADFYQVCQEHLVLTRVLFKWSRGREQCDPESAASRHLGIEAEPTLVVLERIGDPELFFDYLAVLKVLGVQNFAARV